VGLVLTAGWDVVCHILGAEQGEPGTWRGVAADSLLGFLGFRSQREGAGRRQPRRAEHSWRAGSVGPVLHTGRDMEMDLDVERRAQGKETLGCANYRPELSDSGGIHARAVRDWVAAEPFGPLPCVTWVGRADSSHSLGLGLARNSAARALRHPAAEHPAMMRGVNSCLGRRERVAAGCRAPGTRLR
jgi:hypothetical protein